MAVVNIFKSRLTFLYDDVNIRAQSGTFEAERVFLSENNPIYFFFMFMFPSIAILY